MGGCQVTPTVNKLIVLLYGEVFGFHFNPLNFTKNPALQGDTQILRSSLSFHKYNTLGRKRAKYMIMLAVRRIHNKHSQFQLINDISNPGLLVNQ